MKKKKAEGMPCAGVEVIKVTLEREQGQAHKKEAVGLAHSQKDAEGLQVTGFPWEAAEEGMLLQPGPALKRTGWVH